MNAAAVGRVVSAILTRTEAAVTVIACGERPLAPADDGELRVVIEDYLGAGAILSRLPFSKSPEALVCEAAFVGVRDRLEELLQESVSGRELRQKGWAADIARADRLCHESLALYGDKRAPFGVTPCLESLAEGLCAATGSASAGTLKRGVRLWGTVASLARYARGSAVSD